MLVMLAKGVHGFLQFVGIPGRINPGHLCVHWPNGERTAVRLHSRFFLAGSDDRARLRSDLSAVASDHTDGQGLRALPFLVSAHPVVPKAINPN